MLQGTGSDVGKTVLVAGLCRLARNRGLKVRPFKPQNMSNNAAVAADGGEIGRAQWLQALACGVPASVHMNPVLLKPQSETGSQVIVQGKVAGTARGRDYQALKPKLLSAVLDSFARVSDGADLVIVEGAGSPAEINLRAGDIANMGFATAADVPVVLVGDIDRGGVIASLVGTHAILPEADRAMIAGYIINKFRGDVSLFDDGISAIGAFTNWPCFGVVPWLKAAEALPAEDSVALSRMSRSAGSGKPVIAILELDHIANFDDFDPLVQEDAVDAVFVKAGERIPDQASLVIIPGSKTTISDLETLRRHGWDRQIEQHVAYGGHLLGICGGFQMLGTSVADPHGIEATARAVAGLGLLDVATEMRPEKTVRLSAASSALFDAPLEGYEIHLGETSGPDSVRPFSYAGRKQEGAVSANGRVYGTYLHGLFGNDSFRRQFLQSIGVTAGNGSHVDKVDAALDAIAAELEALGLADTLSHAR